MKLLDLGYTSLLSIHREICEQISIISTEIDNLVHRNEIKCDTFDALRAGFLIEQSRQCDIRARLDFERSNHLIKASDSNNTPLPYRNSGIALEIQAIEYRRCVAYQIMSECVEGIKNDSTNLLICQSNSRLSDDQIIEFVDSAIANINKQQAIQLNTLGSIRLMRDRLSQLYSILLTNDDSHRSRGRSGFLRLRDRNR